MMDEEQQSDTNDGVESGHEMMPRDKAAPPVGKRFSKDYQPSDDAKKAGMMRRKRGRELFRMLLQLPADGEHWVPVNKDDPNGEHVEVIGPLRKAAARYFNMPESLVTMEMLAFMKQVAIAIQKNDTYAFNTIMDRAYGKPTEHVEFEDIAKPEIKLVLGKEETKDSAADLHMPNEFPPIAENENELE